MITGDRLLMWFSILPGCIMLRLGRESTYRVVQIIGATSLTTCLDFTCFFFEIRKHKRHNDVGLPECVPDHRKTEGALCMWKTTKYRQRAHYKCPRKSRSCPTPPA